MRDGWPLALIGLLLAVVAAFLIWAFNDLNNFTKRCVDSGGTVQMDQDGETAWCIPRSDPR